MISKHNTDIFSTGYGIDTLISSNPNSKIYKIGATKDLKIRLRYYHKEITDFKIIKSWEINNPLTLESALISYYEKSDFESFGKEWFWDTREYVEKFIDQIEWFIDNSYTEVSKGYIPLFKK